MKFRLYHKLNFASIEQQGWDPTQYEWVATIDCHLPGEVVAITQPSTSTFHWEKSRKVVQSLSHARFIQPGDIIVQEGSYETWMVLSNLELNEIPISESYCILPINKFMIPKETLEEQGCLVRDIGHEIEVVFPIEWWKTGTVHESSTTSSGIVVERTRKEEYTDGIDSWYYTSYIDYNGIESLSISE